jgi:hypothetical protein
MTLGLLLTNISLNDIALNWKQLKGHTVNPQGSLLQLVEEEALG